MEGIKYLKMHSKTIMISLLYSLQKLSESPNGQKVGNGDPWPQRYLTVLDQIQGFFSPSSNVVELSVEYHQGST